MVTELRAFNCTNLSYFCNKSGHYLKDQGSIKLAILTDNGRNVKCKLTIRF